MTRKGMLAASLFYFFVCYNTRRKPKYSIKRDYETEESRMCRKLIGVLLSICMVLLLLPAGALAAAGFSDMPSEDHWSYRALTAAVDNGLLQGSDGRLMPGDCLTRAQLAAFINRAFGAVSTADISGYADVKSTDWYYADIAKAVRMGTLAGASGLMRPEGLVTREEAFTALARALKLPDGKLSSLDVFSDKSAVSAWAAPALAAMAQAGYIQGTDGLLDPAGIMTREQFAQVMHNVFSRYIGKAGTYTESVSGNVLVSADGVTLKGLTIGGDLILGEGVGNGDVTLDGVTVMGRVVVRGGGANSIRIINKTDVGSIIVGKTGDGGVRVRTEEGCSVEVVYIDDGLDDIILEGTFNQVSVQTDAPVVLRDATVTGLTVSGGNADVKLDGKTTVSVTQITDEATGAKLEVGGDAKIDKVESTADGVTISGDGTVTQAIVSGDNTAVDTDGTEVTVEDGATGVTQDGEPVEPETPSNPPGGGGVPHSASVTSLAQLQAALDDSSVSAITIRGSIEITGSMTFNKPVTIADLPGSILIISGILINTSTFINRGLGGDFNDTGLILGGSFTNNGILENESRFAMFEASFTNNGTVNNKNWFHCAGTTIVNNGTFSSIGDLSLLNSDSFDGTDNIPSTFTNAADAAFVAEGPGGVQVRLTCSFTNNGDATVSGYFENYGTLTNNDSFTYTDFLLNAGTITGTTTLTAGDGAVLENDRPVALLAELNAQLTALDDGYDRIAIVGDIELTENLTIRHNVRLTPDGRLLVPSGKTLTVTSDSGYNELNVGGKLEIYGTLVTTQTGEGDDAVIGQVTLTGGALRAYSGSTITNGGVILVLGGDFMLEDGVTFSGHDVVYPSNIVGVSSESELLAAMADDGVDEIEIIGSFTLNEDLDIMKRTTVTYDTLEDSPCILTIASGAALTVRNGAHLSIQGGIVNDGIFVNDESSGGVFMSGTGSFTNSGILNNDHNFDIIEGTLTNNGSVNVGDGDNNVILMRGGIIANSAGATFNNEGAVDMDTSEGLEGAVLSRAPAFTNAGTFNNGVIALPGSHAYCGMRSGTFANTGTFVNNGNVDLTYVTLTHTGGDATFTTYNSAGMHITGGSFSTEGSDADSFNNEGYMRIIDQYGKDGADHACTVTIAAGTLDNDSRWLDYVAQVYSEQGLTDAEAAQQAKMTALGEGENFFGLSVYNRLDIMVNITLTGSKTLSAFPSYWVESTWSWDGTSDVETPATLTVNNGVTLTVGQERSLHAENGDIVNNGTIITAAPTDEGETHISGGAVEVWPGATFTNSGAVTNNGTFILRNDYNGEGGIAFAATVNGNAIANPEYLAMAHSDADIRAAAAENDPVYGRIDIKGDSIIELSGGDLTIDATIYIEPGSGLIVPHGVTLTLTGEHAFDNGGDISVFGDMILGDGVNSFNLFNRGSLEIGALSGGETASVMVSANSLLSNDGTLDIYATGTLDISGRVHAGELNLYGAVTVSAGGFLGIFGNTTVSAAGSLDIDGNAVLNENGELHNNGSVTVGATGTLDASAGSYTGAAPSVTEGGTYTPPEP
jgi:hypothetical protein